MRIPFDLIAAVLCIAGLEQQFAELLLDHSLAAQHGLLSEHQLLQQYFSGELARFGLAPPSWLAILGGWGVFLLVTWLLNELVTRRVEWLTRFGARPEGLGRRHPVVFHTWAMRAVQALTVGLFALTLWLLQWPLCVRQWPEWIGLDARTYIGDLPLYSSTLVATILNLTPYLLSMLLAWMPRYRFACGMRGRRIRVLSFLAYEARLSWLPLVIGVVAGLLTDVTQILPEHYTAWAGIPGVDVFLAFAVLILVATVGVPKLVVWWWQCQPMPEGEFKNRLLALMKQSGVKARAIMVWGPRGSGLLNACVLGPWSSYRYVLISPQLLDELSLEETEAVLAHELGHARYGHLSLLLVMLLMMSALIDPLTAVLPISSPILQSLALMAFVIFYICALFGGIMRQCEMEADLASAELVGTPRPLISALEKLALISGNIRKVWSWHHGSIAQRVETVEKLSADPEGSRRVHARVRLIRVAFGILTVLAIGGKVVLQLTHG